MLKNSNGVTLIALTVTIIVLGIIATIGTYTGLETIENARYSNAISELKSMQAKINEIYEKYKDSDDETKLKIENQGKSISEVEDKADIAYESVLTNKKNNDNIGSLEDYRYYQSDYIKETLDLDAINMDFLVNIKTRTIMLVNGVIKDGVTYYSLSEIDGEQYNVEYIPD